MNIDLIIEDLGVDSWKQAYHHVSDAVSGFVRINKTDLYNCLTEIERQSPSGVGGGVAIPHMMVEGLQKPISILTRLTRRVNIDSVDNEPVDIIVLLLSPQEDGPLHLRRLSRITRLLKNEAMCNAIREAKDQDDIYALINHTLSRQEAA